MIGFIKKLFGVKPAEVTEAVPYKVETPVVVSVDPAVNPVVSTTDTTVVVAEKKPAPKKQPAKKQGAPKKQSSNKPRKPKAPKAQ